MSPANDIIEKCKTALKSHYGSQFKGLVLYGSMARGQAGLASDIDLLVLLSSPFDYFDELHGIINLLYPLQLESERLLSVKPTFINDYERGSIQLYRNAQKEGILV